METKNSAVQLLKEWKRLDEIVAPLFEAIKEYRDFETTLIIDHYTAQMRPISRRLDEMAEDAGISIIGGKFAYESENVFTQGVHGVAYKFIDTVDAREQQAIQEWLLIKNEEKTA